MQYRIALVGASVGLNSIGAALQAAAPIAVAGPAAAAAQPGAGQPFELLRFVGTSREWNGWIERAAPDVVIFDMAAVADGPLLTSLRRYGLVLIGVDLESQQMVIISGEQSRLATVEDLVQVVTGRQPCLEGVASNGSGGQQD